MHLETTMGQCESVSITDRLCLSQTVCVCHILPASVTGSLCLSLTLWVCHRQTITVTDNLCLSQAVCVCHRHSSWSILAWFLLINTWFSPRFVREFVICPAFKHLQHQLCWPLILAYYSQFQHIPKYSSLFQSIPAYSNLFQPISTYSSLFQPIQA